MHFLLVHNNNNTFIVLTFICASIAYFSINALIIKNLHKNKLHIWKANFVVKICMSIWLLFIYVFEIADGQSGMVLTKLDSVQYSSQFSLVSSRMASRNNTPTPFVSTVIVLRSLTSTLRRGPEDLWSSPASWHHLHHPIEPSHTHHTVMSPSR